ncbi:hypothetical protein BDZ97DRAFT_1790970 [Flammula alnicola]|nr:hypothetical protein BDZ97DRAFT_1790970 [Flammula alnicola]
MPVLVLLLIVPLRHTRQHPPNAHAERAQPGKVHAGIAHPAAAVVQHHLLVLAVFVLAEPQEMRMWVVAAAVGERRAGATVPRRRLLGVGRRLARLGRRPARPAAVRLELLLQLAVPRALCRDELLEVPNILHALPQNHALIRLDHPALAIRALLLNTARTRVLRLLPHGYRQQWVRAVQKPRRGRERRRRPTAIPTTRGSGGASDPAIQHTLRDKRRELANLLINIIPPPPLHRIMALPPPPPLLVRQQGLLVPRAGRGGGGGGGRGGRRHRAARRGH